jgi:hypothetical protein
MNKSSLPRTSRAWTLTFLLRQENRLEASLVVALIALVVSIFAGSFWHRPDVVFDKRAVEIPLSDALRESIEDALARSAIRSKPSGQRQAARYAWQASSVAKRN